MAGRAWIRIHVCDGSPRARGVRPEDSRVSGCPDAVHPEGSVSFKPWSLAPIPGTSSRFTKSHRKQYKNSNFSPAKEPKPRQTWTGSLEGPDRNRTSCCLLIRHWDNTDDSEAGLPSLSSWASICRELDQCLLVKVSRTPAETWLGTRGLGTGPEPQAQAGPLAEEGFSSFKCWTSPQRAGHWQAEPHTVGTGLECDVFLNPVRDTWTGQPDTLTDGLVCRRPSPLTASTAASSGGFLLRVCVSGSEGP